MATPQPVKKKQSLNGSKYLMISLCLAIVVGMWNLFSSKAQADQNAQDGNVAAQTVPESILDLPPLPTLVDALNYSQSGSQPSGAQPLASPLQDNSQSSAALRQVDLPTPMPAISQPVTIQAVVISAPSGGNAGGGKSDKSNNAGSKGNTSTRTSSSRK
jgi:hypothetical protein